MSNTKTFTGLKIQGVEKLKAKGPYANDISKVIDLGVRYGTISICEYCGHAHVTPAMVDGVPDYLYPACARAHLDAQLMANGLLPLASGFAPGPDPTPLLARLELGRRDGKKVFPDIQDGIKSVKALLPDKQFFMRRDFPCISHDTARDLLSDMDWLVEEGCRVYSRYPQNQNIRWHGGAVAACVLRFLVDCADLVERGCSLGPHLADLHREYAVRLAKLCMKHNCDAYASFFGTPGDFNGGTSGRAKVRRVYDKVIWAQTIGELPESTTRYEWNPSMRAFVSPKSTELLVDHDLFGQPVDFYAWRTWPLISEDYW